MMHKRTLHSLLIVSFIVAFAASMSFATNDVNIQTKTGLLRCTNQALNVTVNLDQDVSAVECVFVVTNGGAFVNTLGITWQLPAGVLSDRVVDLTRANGTAPDTIRFAAMRTGETDGVLTAGTALAFAQITFTLGDFCSGSANFAGGEWAFPHPTEPIVTQFVDAATYAIIYPMIVAGSAGITNQVPSMAAIADQEIGWGQPLTIPLSATDGDIPGGGCETLTFDIAPGAPAGADVVGTNFVWTPTGDQVCEHTITVTVADECGGTDSEEFVVCVTNEPPQFVSCPTTMFEVAWGDPFTTTLEADDLDGGPYRLFSILSWDGPGTPTVTKVDGNAVVEWTSGGDSEYGGTFTMCVEVTDDAAICDPCSPDNADTCCFQVKVIPHKVAIFKVEDAILGQEVEVPIYTNFGEAIGGWDFLIQYDPSVMSFIFAEEGTFFVDCAWEYFTYRFGPNGNCGPNACPTGIVRVVAMAETNGGNIANHPDCFVPGESDLFVLHFLLSNNALLECQFAPIRFIWYDCADNGLSSEDGEYLYVSDSLFGVWDFAGFEEPAHTPIYNDITGMDNTFPTMTGVGTIDDCLAPGPKGVPQPVVHFWNGGIDIICADSIDAVGDINLNNIPYEIADAVMFTRYFIDGLTAFGPTAQNHQNGSIAASDTNKDGLTLTVADLVYLIRVVIGDAQPYPKEGAVTSVAANYTHDAGVVAVSGAQIGGVAMTVRGEVTPELLVSGMEMASRYDGSVTRIVVTPDVNANTMNSFTGAFVRGIDHEIITIEMADAMGNPVAAKNVPANYALNQNYPNPFNPKTIFSFDLPKAGKYELVIYNIQGQVVLTHNGIADAPGAYSYTWDAEGLASGVYLYRLTSGDFTDVKKAVFLK